MDPIESVILCEGYLDRAFWSGWLEYLGCTNPGQRADRSIPVGVKDPWGKVVGQGAYAFQSRGGRFIRVKPVHSKNNLGLEMEARLQKRADTAVDWLLVNGDDDTVAGDAAGPNQVFTVTSVVGRLHRLNLNAVPDESGVYVLDQGTRVFPVVWTAPDPPGNGLPAQQTLERLVCCALCAAYPERGEAIQRWLDSRPAPPAADVKEFAWSQMAGWYAERGCEDFYKSIWRDEPVAAELEARLRAAGVWDVVQQVAET